MLFDLFTHSRCERALDLSLSLTHSLSLFLSVRFYMYMRDSAHIRISYTCNMYFILRASVPYTPFWYPFYFYLFVVLLKNAVSADGVSYASIGFAPKAAHIGLNLGFMVSVQALKFFFVLWFHMVELVDVYVVADWIWRYNVCIVWLFSCLLFVELNLCVSFDLVCDTRSIRMRVSGERTQWNFKRFASLFLWPWAMSIEHIIWISLVHK